MDVTTPYFIDPNIESRAVSFENPTGARGAGGQSGNGRKGAPNKTIFAGEIETLVDICGSGIIRHIWFAVTPAPPEVLRAQVIEVFYDGATEPSVSVPALDFFALSHGRMAEVTSALVAVQEGRGLNSYIPMPFREGVRVTWTNHSETFMTIYHQFDLTLEEVPEDAGYLHATFRRQNPTTMRDDFVITDGIEGPGRFLGCSIGVRVLDEGVWYGEGEVKMFIDDDGEYPTICGTGLEDYAGSAWGLGRHCAPYAGAPLDLHDTKNGRPATPGGVGGQPTFVSFYRWHVADPVMFRESIKVTIQQIGGATFGVDEAADKERLEYEKTHPVTGWGWMDLGGFMLGIVERVDDYCATAFVYATKPQAVTRVDVAAAVADIGRLAHEQPDMMELISSPAGGLVAGAELPGT